VLDREHAQKDDIDDQRFDKGCQRRTKVDRFGNGGNAKIADERDRVQERSEERDVAENAVNPGEYARHGLTLYRCESV
jgi:hypothetical protein